MPARRDATRGAVLRAGIDDKVLPAFAGRTLAIDTPVARHCARLHAPDPRAERDAPIAATALVHRLWLVTGNESDFQPLGIELLNPWD